MLRGSRSARPTATTMRPVKSRIWRANSQQLERRAADLLDHARRARCAARLDSARARARPARGSPARGRWRPRSRPRRRARAARRASSSRSAAAARRATRSFARSMRTRCGGGSSSRRMRGERAGRVAQRRVGPQSSSSARPGSGSRALDAEARLLRMDSRVSRASFAFPRGASVAWPLAGTRERSQPCRSASRIACRSISRTASRTCA